MLKIELRKQWAKENCCFYPDTIFPAAYVEWLEEKLIRHNSQDNKVCPNCQSNIQLSMYSEKGKGSGVSPNMGHNNAMKEYLQKRIQQAESILATEELAGNVPKAMAEKAAIAELRGVEAFLNNTSENIEIDSSAYNNSAI